MKHLILFLSLILVNIFSYSQTDSLIVELSSDKDIFYENENLVLNVKLTNPNMTSIYIPDTFNVASNICANGLEHEVSGGNIYIDLQPISNWCSLVIEEMVIVPFNFIELKPNSSRILKYDFGKHINEAYPPACDTLGIKLNEKYTIQAKYTYYNDKVEKDKVFFSGTIKSNVIELEIR